jgi:hypothetical protein
MPRGKTLPRGGPRLEGGFKLRKSRSWKCSLWYLGGIAVLVGLILGISQPINAQIATTTATLSGVVADPSGAVLPNATVTLTSAEKSITRVFKTDQGGRYFFNQLPPSAYSLTVTAKSFETYRQKGIVLDAAETATQNVTLTVGAETISVSVTSDVSQLNTDNSNVATDIEAKQIVELPLKRTQRLWLGHAQLFGSKHIGIPIAPGWRQQHDGHRGPGYLVHELRWRFLWNDGLHD